MPSYSASFEKNTSRACIPWVVFFWSGIIICVCFAGPEPNLSRYYQFSEQSHHCGDRGKPDVVRY